MKYFLLVTADHVVRGTIVVVVSQINFARLYVLLLYISPSSFSQKSARKIIQPSCKKRLYFYIIVFILFIVVILILFL